MIKYIVYTISVIWIIVAKTILWEIIGIVLMTGILFWGNRKRNTFRKLKYRELKYGKR